MGIEWGEVLMWFEVGLFVVWLAWETYMRYETTRERNERLLLGSPRSKYPGMSRGRP